MGTVKLLESVLAFSTDKNHYLYDDCTGFIHIWDEIKNTILKLYNTNGYDQIVGLLRHKYGEDDILKSYKYIDNYVKEYNSFFKHYNKENLFLSEEELLNHAVNSNNGLLISMTDDCNMRCKYCVYSETYRYTKNKSAKVLSSDAIFKGIDRYLEFIQPVIISNPRKIFTVAFYGGEPLLNKDLIFKTIDYAKTKYNKRFIFNITTNGLLLHKDVVDKLQERQVHLYVSMDGPQNEHDRLRVDCSGNGTYKIIEKNLQYIREQYPNYYKQYISIVSVFDPYTDLSLVENYFEEMVKGKKLTNISIASLVYESNTTYYDDFSNEDIRKFQENFRRLREKYLHSIGKGQLPTSYSRSILGNMYLAISLRRRYLDGGDLYRLLGNSCFPGTKVFLDTNGVFGICERVNGTHAIGNIHNGINVIEISNIIKTFYKYVTMHCEKCNVSRLCSACFRTFEGNGDFIYDYNKCKEIKKSTEARLVEYARLGEYNPKFCTSSFHREDAYLNDPFCNI